MDTQASAPVTTGQVTSNVVRTLFTNKGLNAKTASVALGIPRSTIYRRLSEGGWDFDEIVTMARYFGVPLSWFAEGIPGLSVGTAGIDPATFRLVGRPLQSPLLSSVPCSPSLIRQERPRGMLSSVK
jgi:hypothetical protein